MYLLKGFAENALFNINTRGVTSLIGEISTQSLTYAREKGFYKSSVDSDITLISFTSKLDDVNVEIPQVTSDHVLVVLDNIYNGIIHAGGAIYADELINSLTANFKDIADTFECGEIIHDDRYYSPEWVSWKRITTDNSVEQIKIWFSDTSFKNEYDEFQIVVISPTDHVDDFFKTGAEVATMLNHFSPSEIMNRVQTAKDGYPETVIRTETFNYVDPLNASHKLLTSWNLLIYGEAGNNQDAVNEAIIKYILAHSTHTHNEWLAILPDLFRVTEFIIVPAWDHYSIPNRTLESGIYSPIINVQTAMSLLEQFAVNYSKNHVDTHGCVLAYPYKSITLLTIGGAENINGWFKISDVFPDYIDVSSTSVDFNRMSQVTQNWILLMASMIMVAETLDNLTAPPVGMNKLIRGNVLYLSKRYNNINYLIVVRKNFI